jgi:hypothetical protein
MNLPGYCKHCKILENGCKKSISPVSNIINVDGCVTFVSSKRKHYNNSLNNIPCLSYTLGLILKDHKISLECNSMFAYSLKVCEKLIEIGFHFPRILINVTGEHQHSWVILDQNNYDKNLFDRVFNTLNGIDKRYTNFSTLTSKPYSTDIVTPITSLEFSNFVPNEQTRKYYVFGDYSSNKVLIATE